jgi:hypothetical protein
MTGVSSIFEERQSATNVSTDQELLIWAMVVDYRMLPQMHKLIGQLVVVIAVGVMEICCRRKMKDGEVGFRKLENCSWSYG